MFHKILVALDQSEPSSQVFEQAVALAKVTNASLMLLHVLVPFGNEYPGIGYQGMDGMFLGGRAETVQLYLSQWKILEQEGLKWLRSREAEAIKAGVEPEFRQSIGDPGRIICTLAQTWEADLIVVGRRGLFGLSELFLGSVSSYVLHHAPCSVLTVQEPLLPSHEVTQEN